MAGRIFTRDLFYAAAVAAIGVCGAMSISAGAAYAQEPRPDGAGADNATPQENGTVLPESETGALPLSVGPIAVSATRNPMRALEYPGMVTVIDRASITARQASTVDDFLSFVPNVEFTGGPRRTGETPTIRGFDGPDVITLLDGARQNFGSAHDGRFFIDPSLLKQVEVLRGASSALYGSGGTGGVIAFETVDAADLLSPGTRFGAQISTGYQSVNREQLGTLSVFASPQPHLDLVGSVTKRDSGSIELGNDQELDRADDDLVSGMAKAEYAFKEYHRLEASIVAFDNDAQEPNNGQGLGGPDLVEKAIRSTTLRGAYSYQNPSNRWLDLDFLAYHTAIEADELRLDALGNGPAGELLKRDVDTVGLRLDNRTRFAPMETIQTLITYGVEAYRDKQDGAAGGGPRGGVPDAEADFLGLFAQAEINIAEPFGIMPGDVLIIPGVRYDEFDISSSIATSNSEDSISPRIGMSYLPNDWLVLFANYGHAFRAPTFDELFLTGVHFRIPIGPGITNRFVPNPNLKPQETETTEFGFALEFDDVIQTQDMLQFKASRFLIDGDDFIDLVVVQPAPFITCNPFIPGNCDGTTNSGNVPRVALRGTEVEASYESPRLRLALGYSTLDGENLATGAKLGVLAPDQFTADAAFKWHEMESIFGWRVLAANKFEKVNAVADIRDGYAAHDLYASWQPQRFKPLRGVRLDLGVDNIFDKSYSRVFTDAPEAGRNLKIAIGYNLSL
ncbi:MAG TPA: TonB-dependent receptor [Alphaproteobacteria bacterium]|nr:TonB-dependent receptor [Alphaproteobacteria bacterium]